MEGARTLVREKKAGKEEGGGGTLSFVIVEFDPFMISGEFLLAPSC